MPIITGGPGADTLDGTDLDDNIVGSGGNDIISGNGGNDFLNGGDDNDMLDGGLGNDDLKGAGGADILVADSGSDRLSGDDGDDQLILYFDVDGSDKFYGGAGTDVLLSYYAMTVNLATNSMTVESVTHEVWDVEDVIGSDASDTITGDDLSNRLTGGGYGDTIDGGGGDDVIRGDDERTIAIPGNDTLAGGLGADHISGDEGDDIITGGDDNDLLDGGTGNDTMNGGNGIDTADYAIRTGAIGVTLNGAALVTVNIGTDGEQDLISNVENVVGGTGDDSLAGDGLSNALAGNSGNDTLKGGGGDDSLSGGNGSDLLKGGGGSDTLDGGSGTDWLSYSNSTAVTVDLSAGTASGGEAAGDVFSNVENIVGSLENDILTGDANANELDGSAGDDTLAGGDGNDVLTGGGGNDSLTGGAGDDSYIVGENVDTVFESVGGGTDTVSTYSTYTLGAGQEIENLRTMDQAGTTGIGLIGNAFANSITGNAGANTINGREGADQLRGLGGNDTYYVDNAGDVVTEAASGGNDQVLASATYALASGQEIETLKTADDAGTASINLTGNDFANSMTGNAGNNVLNGGIGADVMRGLGGNDSFVVDSAGDVVIEAAGGGTDTVFASVSHALQSGQEIENLQTNNAAGVGAINLTGNNLNNVITGNAGNNTLNGGLGIDTLIGLGGDDTYIVDNASDITNESIGGGMDTVLTSVSYALQSGREIEVLKTNNAGSTDALTLTGNQFGQAITGNAGNNVLNGKLGLDTLNGGNGQDSFVFDSGLGASNVDTITSFIVADDTIVLDNAIFAALGLGALAVGAFNTGAAATQADDRIIWNGLTKALLYDADGLGGVAAIQFATITNVGGALSAGDFSVI